jgi:hypothetical protein
MELPLFHEGGSDHDFHGGGSKVLPWNFHPMPALCLSVVR